MTTDAPMLRRSGLFSLVCLTSLLILVGAMTGCRQSPTATPTPTKTPKLEVTPTMTPQATSTPSPIPSPKFTPTPEPTAVSQTTIDPATDQSINPLTGETVDTSVLDRRPLAVKISNAPAIVRPQAGLSFADVVFEHYAEGGLTRFTAIFLSKDCEKIGSIRSGRLIDLEISAMFKSMFAYSGASGGVNQEIRESDIFERVISPDFGHDSAFKRIPAPGKAYEHTLFSDTETLWQVTEQRGLNERQDLHGWVFSEETPPEGTPAEFVKIPYDPEYVTTEYQYDASQGVYLRSVLGEPHTDELTGKQLTASNVIVLFAYHAETLILEDTHDGGHYSIQIQLWGTGPAKIFRDGQVYELQWSRPKRHDLMTFVDAEGNRFPLKPGNSWIQLVPLDFAIEVE
jgi:hypothetical protein